MARRRHERVEPPRASSLCFPFLPCGAVCCRFTPQLTRWCVGTRWPEQSPMQEAGEAQAEGNGDSHGEPSTANTADVNTVAALTPDQVDALVNTTEDVGHAATSAAVAVRITSSQSSRIGSMNHRESVVTLVAAEVASFFATFGRLGVAMVVIFLFSALWTFMLAFLQVYTNDMANAIMNTSSFDNGQFWTLAVPDPAIVCISVVLLVLFGIGYLSLVAYMLFFRRVTALAHGATSRGSQVPTNKLSRALWWLKKQFSNPTPIKRHYFNAALDLPKMIFQTTTLFSYLRRGFPTPLIYFYSALLLANWLVACYRYQRFHVDPHLVLSRLFYMFDLFFAVFSTLVVLVYFVYNFEFDRDTFHVREEVMSQGTFDRVARLFGNPAQISGFCSAFHYLQLTSGSSVFYKSALNILSLYKWAKIIHALIHTESSRHSPPSRQNVKAKLQQGNADALRQKVKPNLGGEKKRDEVGVPPEVKKFRLDQRDLPKLLVAGVFLFAGLAIFTYSIAAVESTHNVCRNYTHCAITSYRWNVGSKDCTCLMFVDRQVAPKTFDEWNNPVDTTLHLSELARAGELRIIQIINRAVPEFPDSVRNCKHLEQIILIYTKTERLPDWITEFSDLEYFHYEGDFTSRRLQALPDDMFGNFPHLTFLHLGAISKVPTIPSLAKLHQLQYLVIAGGYSLTEFPSLEGLGHLNIFTMVDMPQISTLPSFKPLVRIKSISLRYQIPACCNGFLTNKCDLSDYSCSPKPGQPAMHCTNERISAADNTTLILHGNKYCPKNSTLEVKKLAPTVYLTDTLCGGVMYKQCEFNGNTGMCFNSRMQVINCVTIPEYLAMRRLEIARGVGTPCNPDIEAWLGCAS